LTLQQLQCITLESQGQGIPIALSDAERQELSAKYYLKK
jgi:hypothetical protein